MEEGFIEKLAPGDAFLFAGQVWRLRGHLRAWTPWSPRAPQADPKVPSWGGSKFAPVDLSRPAGAADDRPTRSAWPQPAARRAGMAGDPEAPARSSRRATRCWSRPSSAASATIWSPTPSTAGISHGTLAQLLTRRLERAGRLPLGFVANDYALAVWALKPHGRPRHRRPVPGGHAGRRPGGLAGRELHDEARLPPVRRAVAA